jgi:hypothetical protein
MEKMLTYGDILNNASKYSPAQITWDRNPLFDVEGVPSAVTTIPDINFFTKPIGQNFTPGGGAATAKSKLDTNLDQSGKLGGKRLFILRGFHVQLLGLVMEAASAATATALQDMQIIYEAGLFEFSVGGGRPRVSLPLSAIGCGMGFYAKVATAYSAGPLGDTRPSVRVPTNGMPSPSNYYKYVLGGDPKNPGVIEGDVQFGAAVKFPAAVATVTAGITMKVYLDGVLGSIVQ